MSTLNHIQVVKSRQHDNAGPSDLVIAFVTLLASTTLHAGLSGLGPKRGGSVVVSFKTLDLNLLKVFDAVMEERSVLRAGQKVALSQSAVSHSLAGLREMLED